MYIISFLRTVIPVKFSALKQIAEAMYAGGRLSEKTAELKLSAMRPGTV
jgi:hypothetical protein